MLISKWNKTDHHKEKFKITNLPKNDNRTNIRRVLLGQVGKDKIIVRTNKFATKPSVKSLLKYNSNSNSKDYSSSKSKSKSYSPSKAKIMPEQNRKYIVQLPEIKETGKKVRERYRVKWNNVRESSNSPDNRNSRYNNLSSSSNIPTLHAIKCNDDAFFTTNTRVKVCDDIKDKHAIIGKNSVKEKKNLTKTFYYIILPGNSSYLVKNCMGHRANWRECQSSVTTLFNFKWQQNTVGIDYACLSKISTIKQTVNHFEFHTSLSNKSSMFINLTKYCESKDMEVFQYIPFTILMQYDNPNYYLQNENFMNLYNNIDSYIIDYQSLVMKRYTFLPKRASYSSLFPNEEKIGARATAAIVASHYDKKNLWMVKACDLNRGRGIKVANSIQKVQKLVRKFYDGIFKGYADENDNPLTSSEMSEEMKRKLMLMNKYKTDTIIVQKYIEKPLLYRGRKFDIRVWVLITHKYEVYAFKEGHLKTCSVKFDINALDSYVHITNYSLQKYNENFSKFEYGNEVSFSSFQQFMKEYHPKYNFPDLLAKIKEIISLTCKSVKNKLNAHDRKNCFEIFGYDFMMDVDFNIFLIEINSNPGLEESSPLMTMLIPRMLDDALRLTIDEIYDTKYCYCPGDEFLCDRSMPYCSPFPVMGYSNSENIWSLVCDLNEREETWGVTRGKFKFSKKAV